MFGNKSNSAPQGRGVWLGAFGKHPGWNDHIDDLGLETERLVRFKALVYLEGIGTRIDSGAWDVLKEPERLEGFDHWLVLRSPGEIVLARLWSSTDGKGRSKYPMVIAMHAVGMGLEWCVRVGGPELQRLQDACRRVETSAEVVRAVDESRAALRAQMGAGESTPDVVVPSGLLKRLGERHELKGAGTGVGEDGLLRVLYHMERESGGEHARGYALRLPRCAPSALEGAATWIRAVLSRIDDRSAVLAMSSESQEIVDVVIGEATGADMFALRATRERVPLTTEIPYTIDAEHAAQLRAAVEGSAGEPDRAIGAGEAPRGKGRRGSSALVWALVTSVGAAMAIPTARAQTLETVSQEIVKEPRTRYNEALEALAKAASAPDASDERVRAAVSAFVSEVKSLRGGIEHLSQVSRVLERLDAAMNGQVLEQANDDLSGLGPAATGIYRAVRVSPTRVRFEAVAPESAAEPIEFERVESDVSLGVERAFYLGVTEVSVGQALGMLRARRMEAAWRELNPPTTTQDDAREGLRTWEWGTRSSGSGMPRVSGLWFGAGTRDPWMVAKAIGVELPGPTPRTPTSSSPMQQIAVADAILISAAFGCRLPSVQEWNTALKAGGEAGATGANRRDQSWRAYQVVVDRLRAEGGRRVPSEGDLGSFDAALAAQGHGGTKPGTDDVVSADDGVQWLAPVEKRIGERADGENARFVHLVGNVAEYVTVERPKDDAPQAARASEALAQAGELGDSVRVIGASALSPASVSATDARAMPAEIRHMGFADVGMRLAFAAPGAGREKRLADRVMRVLDPMPRLERR